MSQTPQDCLHWVVFISTLCPCFSRPGLGVGFVPLPDGVKEDVDQNYEKRKYEAEQQPNIHNLDGGGCRQTVGHWDVESRQNHHAGDVDGDDGLQELRVGEVVGRLIDDVHEDGGQICHNEDAGEVSHQFDLHPDQFGPIVIDNNVIVHIINVVLTNTRGAAVVNSGNW